jgi:hypothetical protein
MAEAPHRIAPMHRPLGQKSARAFTAGDFNSADSCFSRNTVHSLTSGAVRSHYPAGECARYN